MFRAGQLGFRLIRVSPIDCFVAAYHAAGLFRMSNRPRQLRSYLLSWGALGCFRLAPGWGRLVRTWAFPALEPLGMEGARTPWYEPMLFPRNVRLMLPIQKPPADRFLHQRRLPTRSRGTGCRWRLFKNGSFLATALMDTTIRLVLLPLTRAVWSGQSF
jgi:hypothetical protein